MRLNGAWRVFESGASDCVYTYVCACVEMVSEAEIATRGPLQEVLQTLESAVGLIESCTRNEYAAKAIAESENPAIERNLMHCNDEIRQVLGQVLELKQMLYHNNKVLNLNLVQEKAMKTPAKTLEEIMEKFTAVNQAGEECDMILYS